MLKGVQLSLNVTKFLAFFRN